jgi:hypothetical protein
LTRRVSYGPSSSRPPQDVPPRLVGRVRDFEIEQAVERGGIAVGVVERAESPLGFALDRFVLPGEFPGARRGAKPVGGGAFALDYRVVVRLVVFGLIVG